MWSPIFLKELILLGLVLPLESIEFIFSTLEKVTCQKGYWCLYGSCQFAYIPKFEGKLMSTVQILENEITSMT